MLVYIWNIYLFICLMYNIVHCRMQVFFIKYNVQ